ncbi:MAG: alpha-amylase family glycosyl hydrolase [Myxococcota bacterium]
MTPLLLTLSGCCGGDAPVWTPLDDVYLTETVTLDLTPFVSDDRGEPVIVALEEGPDVIAEVDGLSLDLTPQPGWRGTTTVTLTATDACGNEASTVLTVIGGEEPVPGEGCPVELVWTGSAEAVHVAGPFNDWSETATPLQEAGGTWSGEVLLPPGDHPYKLVVSSPGGFGGGPQWTCDPLAAYIQCDPGYAWPSECTPGAQSCNSVVRVADCTVPVLELASLDLDRDAGRADLVVTGTTSPDVTVDGVPFPVDGPSFTVGGLSAGRHEIVVSDGAAEPLVVPFWTDDFAWEQATLYFAFIDRVKNGSTANDTSEGATAELGRYQGGDFVGLREMLPYLDDLGVGVLWLSNVQDNAEGAYAGDCGRTYAGYHAYWPDDPEAIEEHFGTEAELAALIDDAHARGMRVVMDWVGNHVHDTHPWVTEHPDWFNGPANCLDYVDGQINFDRIPETCWFAPYLPDFDYTKPEPLFAMVDDGIGWATRLKLDGFRVDAVKHMPHSVVWNLNAAVEEKLEHRLAGGDERFWTIGETFDGHAAIERYVGDTQLDGQFDFPMYWALRGAFVGNDDLAGLLGAMQDSEARYAGALMSVFLGNHDVARFMSEAAGQGSAYCVDGNLQIAPVPGQPEPYERMMLGLSVVFTQPGVPLVYYGDEAGMPGFGDPDNRQPLWWLADLEGVTSVEGFASRLTPDQARVARHVRALAQARKDHPAFAAAPAVEWWREYSVLGYARSAGDDHVLVLVNREGFERTLTNGLAFAGLPQGTWVDVLTGDSFTSSGDSITIPLGARQSRVLVQP